MPSPGSENVARGYVIPIGGAEDKGDNPVILQRFCSIAGGQQARIVVIPTASELDDTGPRYVELLQRFGAGQVECVRIDERADANCAAALDVLHDASGIFITGGNQLRLSSLLGGTRIARSIRRLNAHGVHVAGTSAGAAIMPEHMIAGGRSGSTPSEDGVTLAPGLGLTNRLIIDQHFRQRDRLGRLLTALSYNPFVSGLGLDEDTAAFIDPNGVLEVVGSGALTIVDPGRLQHSSMGSVARSEPITLIGLTLHVLAQGATYDSESRAAKMA